MANKRQVDTKNNTPRVGIFMPAYNQGQYIHEAIESLKKQTYQDFIVHIVDDGSTDGATPSILRSIRYSKAKKFLNTSNAGMNIRTGEHLSSLHTELMFILCADDTIEPTFIEKCVAFLDANPSHAAVATAISYFGSQTGVHTYDNDKVDLKNMLVENNFLGSSLVRGSAMEEIGWTNQNLRVRNDYDRWVSILENGHKLGTIDEPLFNYRILESSLSRSNIEPSDVATFYEQFINKHRKAYTNNFEYVITELQSEKQRLSNEWQEKHRGHEWLDAEYRKQLKQITAMRKQNKELTVELNRITSHWLYKLLRLLHK